MQFPEKVKEQYDSNFRRTVFLRIYPGQHIVRILGPTIHHEFTHYIANARATIQCPGEGCPICDNNRNLRAENPNKKTNDIPGYSSKRSLYYTNVFDRTPIKRCPSCQAGVNAINTDFPPVCPSCKEGMLSDVAPEPCNEIKVFSRGEEFRDHLELVQKTELDANGEEIGLENYDIQLLVGANKQPIPSAISSRNDVVEFDEEDLFDLPEVIIKLNPDEIRNVLRGVALRDIFLARNAGESTVSENVETDTRTGEDEVAESIAKAKSLFD